METKRKRGRPPGEHGPYKSADDKREKYMIRLPHWIIEDLKRISNERCISIGRLIELAVKAHLEISPPTK